jgi:polyisoprenoid-binding protein YceI
MTQTFTLDRNHTRLEFSAKHMMVTTVRGSFEDFTGAVELETDDPTSARASATVKTASIWTGVEMRDNHLRSDDFFGVEKYPEMSFQSTAVEKTGENTYKVTGELTIRDVTRPITLDVEVEGQIIDPYGNERVGVSARGRLNRKDWGLNWNQAIEAGGVVVSDNINITVEAALVRKAEVAAAATA